MKVALVNPPLESSRERQYARMVEPRLGLGYLAAYLESKGIGVTIIDAKFEGLRLHQVMERLGNCRPDMVGFTAFTTEIKDAAHVAAEVKKALPGVPVVVGGAHPTALPARTLSEFECFDFAVCGEGELTLHELVEHVEGKAPAGGIAGLAYRNAGVVVNPPRPFIDDLDRLPSPAWRLLPRAEQYPIEASRGCPFQCKFCCRIMGNRVRLRSPERVVAEMESTIALFHPGRFSFSDETFGVNRKHTNELLDLMIEKGIPHKVKWNVTTRVDVVKPEFMDRLKSAGCTSVGLGIESGSQAILDSIGKGTTLEKAAEAVAVARRSGLRTNSFFILGHPNETRQTAQDTIDFAAKLNTSRVNFGIMVPYPGTEIAGMVARGEGNYRLLSTDWADYGKQVGNVLELGGLSRADLEKLQLQGYLKFYLRNFSPARLFRFAREVGFRAVATYLLTLPRKRSKAGK